MDNGWQDDDMGLRQGWHTRPGRQSFSGDVYAMYFSKELFDKSKLSKEEFALLKEQDEKKEKEKKEAEEKAKDAAKDKKPADTKPDKDSAKKIIAIDWDNLTERKSEAYIYIPPGF